VHRLALGQELALFSLLIWFAVDSISKLEHRTTQQGRAGFYLNFIVVAGRSAIAATGLGHRQNALVLGFQPAIGKAQ
jgi:hypothetical protein